MPAFVGNLKKMKSEIANPIRYWLLLGDEAIALNSLLKQKIKLRFTGNIHCIQCGRKTKQSFQQGYCYPCMQRLNECNLCTIHPERCLVEQGNCSEHDWAHAHCHQQHIVYLANSSGLKVGITRHTQVPTRWIDQGAVEALPIYHAGNRYQSGLVEMIFKKQVADKTDWRKMLRGAPAHIDLVAEKQRLFALVDQEMQALQQQYKGIRPIDTEESVTCEFPVLTYPAKFNSFNFDKNPLIEAQLMGIKGQYLIFDSGVINIRKFSGYEIEIFY